ncbi:MAG: hypothetical protein LBR66_06790 [Candidatus Symbiothrix sp.]|jgi:hypothetical protein|nr:hypothetical protein [Candidatus Symbiothrix sp.]
MRKLFSLLLALTALWCCGAVAVNAKTIYVTPSGAGNKDGSDWANAYDNVSTAVAAAASGDIVALQQGTYQRTGHITPVATNVQLQGGYTGVGDTREINPANTIYKAENTPGRIFEATTDAANGFTLSGITFTANEGNLGHGGFLQLNNNVIIEDCIIDGFINTYSATSATGGGLFRTSVAGYTLTINRCRITNCQGSSHSSYNAIFVFGNQNGTFNIYNTIINGCTTRLLASASNDARYVNIINSVLANNTVGIDFSTNSGKVITNSIIYNTPVTSTSGAQFTNCYANGSLGSNTQTGCYSFTSLSEVLTANYTPTAALVDKGTTVSVGATDIAGNPRTYGSIDIGPYENIEVTNYTAGANIASLSAYGLYGSTAVYVSLTTAGNDYVPDYQDGVIFTQVNGASYTAIVTNSIPVTKTADIEAKTFTASQATTTVTVSYPSYITVTGPALSNVTTNNGITTGTYLAPANSAIYFSLEAIYENPEATVTDATAGAITETNGIYTLPLTNIIAGATVRLSASLINYTLNKVESNATVSFAGGTSATTAHYNDEVTGTVSVTSPYHSPYVSVDGVYTALDGNNQFTFTVTGNTTVAVTAFAENVIPVSEDTYVSGKSGNQGDSYSSDVSLRIRKATSTYDDLRSYIRFVIPEDIRTSYNKAELKLSLQRVSVATKLELRKANATVSAVATLNGLTWSECGETNNTFSGDIIWQATANHAVGSEENGYLTTDEVVSIDVSSCITEDTETITLQPSQNGGGGYVMYRSLENGNPDYVPVLVFSQPAFKVSAPQNASASNYITSGDNANGDVIFYEDGQLLDATDFTPVNGVVKVVKTFQTDKWYPIGAPFEIASVSINDGTTTHVGIPYIGTETVPADPANFVDADDNNSVADNFFLAEYDGEGDKFKFTQTFTQNKGYVIEFPLEGFQVNYVTVTFTSTANPLLKSTVGIPETMGSATYKLIANPNVANWATPGITGATAYYQYGYDNSGNYVGNNNHFGIVVDSYSNPATTLTRPLQPFEAFVVTKSGSLRSSIGIGATETPVALPAVITKDPVVKTEYYNLQGQRYSISPKNGISAGTPYIVKEVHQSGKVTSKVISGK